MKPLHPYGDIWQDWNSVSAEQTGCPTIYLSSLGQQIISRRIWDQQGIEQYL